MGLGAMASIACSWLLQHWSHVSSSSSVLASFSRLRKKEGRAQYYFMKHGRMEIECLHDLSWSIENCATSVRSGLFPQPVRTLYARTSYPAPHRAGRR